ncbi:sensor histidine kinase [Streptomyces buecherae]|uniref:sensor histidine kinase n=1 Tax=Streptomyces buecherae TaxID=2763006 RepID=UPI00367F30C4
MNALFRPLARAETYTRWLHLLVSGVFASICLFVFPGTSAAGPLSWAGFLVLPVPILLVLSLIPAVRSAEGVQARLLLTPGRSSATSREDDSGSGAGRRGSSDEGRAAGPAGPGISVAPARGWAERGQTALWLLVRVLAGTAVLVATVWLPGLSVWLVTGPGGWWALLTPLPVVALAALVVGVGAAAAQAARWLLAPSNEERLAALEERTERLLEHNRLARELHDSIGHALTVAVVQAGAARAAGSAPFTERALAAIEDTGRRALEDLERVLRLLRQDGPADGADATRRPALTEVERLVESARAAGAPVDAEVSGDLDRVPGPLSREGYRIVQEALTNALRHAGPVPVVLRVTARDAVLELDIRNPLPTADATRTHGSGGSGGGSGLRGIRERAALLGGEAHTGPADGRWRVRVRLPLDRLP